MPRALLQREATWPRREDCIRWGSWTSSAAPDRFPWAALGMLAVRKDSTVPPIRKRSKSTADRAVRAVEDRLDEAGCAVNELVQNDYGFDLHVQLPDRLPEEADQAWPMSPYS